MSETGKRKPCIHVPPAERERLIAKAKKLRAKGWSYNAIGRELGVSVSAVRVWLDPKAKAKQDERNARYRTENADASRERDARYYAENADAIHERDARYRATPKGRVKNAFKDARRRHGDVFDRDEVVALSVAAGQHCQIFGLHEDVVGKLTFDHCHDSNKPRGFIAGCLNDAMGEVNDDPSRLLALACYFRRKPTNIKWTCSWRKTKAGEAFKAERPCCEACGTTEDLCIDHCHDSGFVRGRLCHHCNKCLGQLEKMAKLANVTVAVVVQKLVAYLRKHAA